MSILGLLSMEVSAGSDPNMFANREIHYAENSSFATYPISLVAVILATLTTTSMAGSFTRGCAARDMQILMLIEDREATTENCATQCAP